MKSLPTIVVVEAPSNLGLKPAYAGAVPGVYRLPDALKETMLFRHLGVERVKHVAVPNYRPEIDTETGIRNAQAIRKYSISLADVIGETIQDGKFPLVIGGDCSILLGSVLALRRLGRYGLLFVDGHTDFQTPETSGTGGAAGMDLALATGYGPTLLTNIDGYEPLIDEKQVVAFGFRDIENPNNYPARLIFDTAVQLYSLDSIRVKGVVQAIAECIEQFRRKDIDGIWLHIDADALDDTVMPAVDSRQPGGLTYDEMSTVIRALLASDLLIGMQITILDPDLDPDGIVVEVFANRLAIAIKPS